MKKIFVLSINGKTYEVGDRANTPDEVLENALELAAYVRGIKFINNISGRLYTSNLDQRLEKLFNGEDRLEFTKDVFIKRINCKQYNKGA